jgi:hypothetical protein
VRRQLTQIRSAEVDDALRCELDRQEALLLLDDALVQCIVLNRDSECALNKLAVLIVPAPLRIKWLPLDHARTLPARVEHASYF